MARDVAGPALDLVTRGRLHLYSQRGSTHLFHKLMRTIICMILVAAAGVLPLLGVPNAEASQVVVVPHTIDSTEVGVDKTPPARPAFTVRKIRRGVGPRHMADGTTTSTSADNFASVEFVVETSDDRSKAFEIGYRTTLVAGSLPEGLQLPKEAYRALGCGGVGNFKDCLFFLHWLEDSIDFQTPFDFTITAIAIDKAGNMSEPSEPIRVTHEGVTVDQGLTAAIDSIAENALDRGPIAGLSVAVFRGRARVHVRGYGLADVEKRIPAGAHTPYDIGAVGEIFTSIAIMRLVDAGVMRLDDPLSLHLPDFPNADQADRISIRYLLNHTSGLHDFDAAAVQRAREAGAALTSKDVFDYLRDRPLDFEPGSQWSRSRTGFHLAVIILVRATRQSYDDVLLNLLGIHSMSLRDTDPCGELRAMGDAGLCSTVYELCTLPRILGSVRILSGPALDEMTKPAKLTSGISVDYGLGVRLGALEGQRLWGHADGTGNCRSVLAHYPDDELTIVVLLANTGGAAEDALSIEGAIARVALGLGDKKLKNLRLPSEEARALASSYDSGSSRVAISRSRDGLLWAREGEEQPPRTLRYQGNAAFIRDGAPSDRVQFHLRRGRVLGISEYRSGMFATFWRPARD
jgi:D-alanyl-D-alanine carboxypeptidase